MKSVAQKTIRLSRGTESDLARRVALLEERLARLERDSAPANIAHMLVGGGR